MKHRMKSCELRVTYSFHLYSRSSHNFILLITLASIRNSRHIVFYWLRALLCSFCAFLSVIYPNSPCLLSAGGPTRGASSECSSSFYLGIGVAVGIGSCIVLALGYAFYRWKSKRRGAAHFTTKQEEGEEGGGLMLNLAPETGLANENKTVKA